jgi:hypothetical protein
MGPGARNVNSDSGLVHLASPGYLARLLQTVDVARVTNRSLRSLSPSRLMTIRSIPKLPIVTGSPDHVKRGLRPFQPPARVAATGGGDVPAIASRSLR